MKWKDCLVEKEITILKKIKHPNIIKLFEVIKQKNNLYLIYEFVDMNLLTYYTNFKNNNMKI